MSAIPKRKLSVAEYLNNERTATFKSEYYRGETFAMAGASHSHNVLKDNLIGEMYGKLKGGSCRTVSADERVKIDRTGLFTYPDIAVVCGQAEFAPEAFDTLTNPQVIIEILSPSTESYDRGKKFRHYQQLPSVREYVLVSQDRKQIERFVRQPDETWVMTVFADPEGEFAFATVPVTIAMTDLYTGVVFEEEPDPS